MRRTLVIALVALLALPGPGLATGPAPADAPPGTDGAVAVPATAPDPSTAATTGDGSTALAANHTPTRLDLAGDTVAAYGVPPLDFGATVATVDTDLTARYRVERTEVMLADDVPATVRGEILHAQVAAIEAHLETLRERERTVVRAYHAGNVSEQDLLQELARIDAEAEALQRSLRALDTLDEGVEGVDISGRAGALRAQLELLEGPVRERVDGALAGDGPTPVVRVQAARTGVVLGTIDGGHYYREAVRFDNVNRSAPDSFDGFGDLDERAIERYGEPPVSLSRPSDGLYVVEVEHPQGTITAYFDGGTGELFRETQELRTDDLPRTEVTNATRNGLTVRLHRAAKGGPLLVNVTEASTGEPVDATVSIRSTTLGRTGDDGRLWTIEPDGIYRLRVTAGDRTNNVTVTS